MSDVEPVSEGVQAEAPRSDRRDVLERLGSLLRKSAGCLLLSGMLAVFLIVLLGSDTLAYIARWTLFLTLMVFLAGLFARLVIAVGDTGFTRVVRASLAFVFALCAAAICAMSLVPPAP